MTLVMVVAFGSLWFVIGLWCLLRPHQIEQNVRADEKDDSFPKRPSELDGRNIVLETRIAGVCALIMSAIAFYTLYVLLFK